MEPTHIVLEGIEVTPHFYEEKQQRNGMSFMVRFALPASQATRLNEMIAMRLAAQRQIEQYFPVHVRGSSDETYRMRYGAVIWSEHTEMTKYELNLVQESLDLPPYSYLDLDEIGEHVRDTMVADTASSLTALIAALRTKGVLTAEDESSIVEAGKAGRPAILFDFRKVRDVDEWTHLRIPGFDDDEPEDELS